jgi:hypothetical protein
MKKRNSEPLSPLWVYIDHIVLWFLSGSLFVLTMASIRDKDWFLLSVSLFGAMVLAWVAHKVARDNGYIDALYQAYMEDYRKRSQKRGENQL